MQWRGKPFSSPTQGRVSPTAFFIFKIMQTPYQIAELAEEFLKQGDILTYKALMFSAAGKMANLENQSCAILDECANKMKALIDTIRVQIQASKN